MYFSTLSTLSLSLATLTVGLDFSSSRDANADWEVPGVTPNEGFSPVSNRPAKRQAGWNPPSNLRNPLKQVWDHCLATYNNGNLYGFKNFGWDQIKATGGKLNICVRWESGASVTEAQRNQIASVYAAQYQKWFQWLYGFDAFPWGKVEVKIVGWAVRNRNQLQGSTAGLDIYTNTDSGGAPECLPACGRFFNQNNNYGGCPGGAARHYDHSLWLTDGFAGGAGGDWGQRIGREYFMGALSSPNIHILLHEMGHTFGLDDFYDWTPSGVSNFIMLAGSSMVITDFDGWMLRNWWYELSRNRGWR